MRERIQHRSWQGIFGFFLLSVLSIFSNPPILHAAAPNVVLNRAIHFPTINGTPVTLSPGKYLVEQSGSEELRMTAVANNEEFLIQAEALTHEQYELFSAMALTRYSKDHEFRINLYLPGGVRLVAKGSSKELPKPISGQGPPPMKPVAETSASSTPQSETPHIASTTDSEPPVTSQSTIIPGQGPPPIQPIEELPIAQADPIAPPVETPEVFPIIPDPEPPAVPKPIDISKPALSFPEIIEEPAVMTYQPPSPDQPGFRIDGKSSDPQFPSVFVLAPNHIGHTSQEHPVLFWYLSQETQDPLDVMIAEEGSLEVLLDIRLLPPLQAGIHELRLEEYGISLLPEVPYRWTIRIQSSQTSEAITASGAIQRIQRTVGSSTPLAYSPEGYAQKGQWYDALTVLANLLQDSPNDTTLLAQRSSLLEQVGLTEAAAFDQPGNIP